MLPFLDTESLLQAYQHWQSGQYNQASGMLLLAEASPQGGQTVVARGIEAFLSWTRSIRFPPDEIQKLGALRGPDGYSLFDESFLNYLQRFDFQCAVDAVAEGTSVFPGEPLLKISGPLIQVELVRTAMLKLIGGLIYAL